MKAFLALAIIAVFSNGASAAPNDDINTAADNFGAAIDKLLLELEIPVGDPSTGEELATTLKSTLITLRPLAGGVLDSSVVTPTISLLNTLTNTLNSATANLDTILSDPALQAVEPVTDLTLGVVGLLVFVLVIIPVNLTLALTNGLLNITLGLLNLPAVQSLLNMAKL